MRSRVRFGVLAPVMVMVVCSAVLLTLPSRSAVGQEVEAGTGNISGQGEVEAGTGNTADFSGGVDRGGYPGGEDTGGFDQTAGRPDRLGTTPDTPHGTFSHALEGTGRTDVPAEAFSGGVTGSESDALFGSVFFMDIPEFQIVVKRGKVYSYEEVLQINAPGVTILGFPDLETFALSRFQGQIVATDISS